MLRVALLLSLFDPTSLGPYDGKKGVQGEFLRALELEDAGKFQRAGEIFESLIERYPLLAPYHAYHGARCAYYTGRGRAGLRMLAKIPADSVLDAAARLLRADTQRALRQDAEMKKTYREYLKRYPDGMRLAEVYYRLGDYRRAYVLGTGTPWEKKARAHVDPKSITSPERVERAMFHFNAMRNETAEEAFADALSAPGLTPASECEARYYRAESVFRQRNRTRAAPLYDEAAEACERAKNEDLLVKSLYQAGRCLNSMEKYDDAARRLRRVQATNHSYADDARLREAEGRQDAGDDKGAADLLTTIPQDYPDGDMVGDAIWRLARDAIEKKNYQEALAVLDRGLAVVPREDDFWAEGRSLYWRGRVLTLLSKKDDAAASFERCAREYPLTYYALMSFNRLREIAPQAARTLEKELLEPIPERPEPLVFTDRPLFSAPAFKRAVEFIRLGLGNEARRELLAAGVFPGGKEEDALWLAAVLYDRAGRWRDAHWIPRQTLTGYKLSYPHGSNAARWRLSYPRGFTSLVQREAKRNDIPEALLYAIVREESAFDPDIESWANAIGLTQLLVPTAKRFSPGLRVNARTLRRPEVNLRIGARFLAFLWNRFDQTAPLAVASYNAGEGAVDRWVRERGDIDLDLFVEQIPYDQTRRYTKRVLSSFFAYRALRGDEPSAPSLPLRRSDSPAGESASARR